MNDKNKILKQRAKALARASETKVSALAGVEFLEFGLAHEKYAIEACHVREVYPLKRITPVPCTPPFVLGIINLRGQICSVIDIKKLIGLPHTATSESSKVIVVFNDKMEVGILADDVVGVRKFLLSEIKDDLSSHKAKEGYLSGVTVERVGILDIGKLLGDDSVVVYEEVD